MALQAGWIVNGISPAGLPAVAHKPAEANKQHIIFAVFANFSAAPAAAVLLQLVNPDVSPNEIYYSGYVPITNTGDIQFSQGVPMPIGAAVDAVLAGNGSLVGRVSLHGKTV